MADLLLDLIIGSERSIEAVIPWTFAYDRQNYARFTVPYLNNMRALPKVILEVYDAFVASHFSVQMSKGNPFG